MIAATRELPSSSKLRCNKASRYLPPMTTLVELDHLVLLRLTMMLQLRCRMRLANLSSVWSKSRPKLASTSNCLCTLLDQLSASSIDGFHGQSPRAFASIDTADEFSAHITLFPTCSGVAANDRSSHIIVSLGVLCGLQLGLIITHFLTNPLMSICAPRIPFDD